jgi:hypothetical protein
MEARRDLGDYFLDRVTGEVVYIPIELQALVETGEELWDCVEWEQDLLRTAENIYFNGDPRWVRIPEVSAGEICDQMMAFSRATTEKHLKELLKVALNDLRAFRLFEETLDRFPEVRERWEQWKLAFLKERAQTWLEIFG